MSSLPDISPAVKPATSNLATLAAAPPRDAFYHEVPIEDIIVPEGRRPIDETKMPGLIESIRETGLQHPIGLDKDYHLVHGLHRLEVFRRLGLKTIPTLVHNLDALRAKLAEIDENVQRASLTELEMAEALAARKEIFETLHPETAAGKAQAAGMNRAQGNHVTAKMATTFAEDTAAKIGKSARTIRRYVGYAKMIPKEVRKQLKTSTIENSQRDLEALGRMTTNEQGCLGGLVCLMREGRIGSNTAPSLRDVVLHHVKTSDNKQFSWGLLEVLIAKSALNALPQCIVHDSAQILELSALDPNEQRQAAKLIKEQRCESVSDAVKVIRQGVGDSEITEVFEGDPAELSREIVKRNNEFYAPVDARPKPLRQNRVVEPEPELPEGVSRGVGVDRANEAINCLKRIPKNDRLRKRGFQIVTDWINRYR